MAIGRMYLIGLAFLGCSEERAAVDDPESDGEVRAEDKAPLLTIDARPPLPVDAQAPDRGLPPRDAVLVDAALPPDAQTLDAQVPDAQIPDAQILDAQIPDAQIPDAQIPDAAPPRPLPNAGLFHLDCDPIIYARNERPFSCRVSIASLEGPVVTALGAWSEAGTMLESALTDANGQATLPGLTNSGPLDVEPLPYELETDLGFGNPRDGLARVVVLAIGEEAFVDVNGDRRFDAADGDFQEPAMDLPEPFLDLNDDGIQLGERDGFFSGETWRDVNRNGTWDGPDGRWNARREIWVATTMLWVFEPLHSTFEVTCDPACTPAADLPPEHPCFGADLLLPPDAVVLSASAHIADQNGNCLANSRYRFSWLDMQLPDFAGEITGDLCFVASERPLAQPLQATVLVPGGPLRGDLTLDLEYTEDGPRQATFRQAVCRP